MLLKAQEIEKRRTGGGADFFDMVIDSEKNIEAASLAAWVTTTELWKEDTSLLRSCVMQGLAEAVERSAQFIMEKEAEYEWENVQGWVREFIDSFKPESLLSQEESSCASAT
jgi:hypothetical protein